MKNNLNILIKVIVSLSLLIILYFNIDIGAIIQTIKKFNLLYVPVILILLILNYVISSVRWQKLLLVSSHISVWYLTKLYFIGAFFNNFMPTSIGGDVYKVYKLGKKINDAPRAFSATFMERFTGVLALFVIASVSSVMLYKYIGIAIIIAIILSIYAVIYAVKFVASKFPTIKKYTDAISYYKKERKKFYFAIFTSFAIQFVAILTQYLIFLALGVKLNVPYSFAIFPVITLASFFIPSLNGIGIQDSLYGIFFSTVATLETALAASVLYHFFRLLVSLVGGIFYAFDREIK